MAILDERLGATVVPAPTATPAPSPGIVPATAAPLPTSAAATPTPAGWISNVYATCWGNKEDEGGEWSEMAYPWSPACTPGSGKTTLGAALPAKVARGTIIQVRLSSHRDPWVTIPVIDMGPWNVSDAYWRTGKRPQAESGTDRSGRRTNKAGLDLTPLAWSVLTGQPVEECWSTSPSGYVDLRVIEPGDPGSVAAPEATLGEKIVEAANNLPEPFPYAPETEGGVLGCANVVSYALRSAGVIPDILLSVDSVTDALKRKGWLPVDPPYRCGDVISWMPWEGSNGHKHIGIIEIEDPNVVMVWNNSSSKRAVDYEPLEGDPRPIEMVLRNPEEK